MTSVMAAAAAAPSVFALTVPGKAQFARGELGFSLSARWAPVGVFPLRTARRRGRSGRPQSGAVRASSSGTADENMIPESSPSAGGYDSVDGDMMMLRRRIEGMRMKETFIRTPDEWMEWEKSWYKFYRADVNVLVASLQSQLLGMRPVAVLFIISSLCAVTPVAAFLFLYALATQLYTMNNAVLEFLAPCSAASNPPL